MVPPAIPVTTTPLPAPVTVVSWPTDFTLTGPTVVLVVPVGGELEATLDDAESLPPLHPESKPAPRAVVAAARE